MVRYIIHSAFVYSGGTTLISNKPGNGPVWMEGLECTGEEKSLEKCEFSGWGSKACPHIKDVVIKCDLP